MLAAYQRAPRLRLRRTSRGGAAFLPETARTVELDADGFAALTLLTTAQTARDLRRALMALRGRNVTVAAVEILLRDLAELGFVTPSVEQAASLSVGQAASLPEFGAATGRLTACPTDRLTACPTNADGPHSPESVHLQLNNVCNLRCPSCYVDLQKEDVGSLPRERLLALIDEWAAMGVFQLALGGGEPLLSPNFAPVVHRARELGIVPNVTTNGWLLTETLLAEVAGSIGEVRLSLNDTVSADTSLLAERAALLHSHDVRCGFNLIATRPNLAHLPDLFRWAREHGAATINLIRPKPAPGNASWYTKNALRPEDARRLLEQLRAMEPTLPRVTVTVDCAFSFLFHGRPVEELQSLGIIGCPMGERFATVKWNGDVYPCSHLHDEGFCAGSVRESSFRSIWEQSAVFDHIRRELGHVEGHCGTCSHNPSCKGCRAVMQYQTGHWLAADHECAFAPAAPPVGEPPTRTSSPLLLPMLGESE